MWNDLTMQQRADVISMAVKAGMRDMKSIRSFYDEALGSRRFDDGGGIKKYYFEDLEDIGYDADNMKFYEKATGKELGDSVILDEVIVNSRNRANDYLTEANDNTSVYNVPHREYNQHLKDRAEQGARQEAIWREEHPNLSAWGEFAASIPLAVASVPLIAGGAEALAGTSAGQAMSSGLLSLSNLAKGPTIAGAPAWAWADAGLTSAFGAHGVKEMANGNFTPITALEILPFAQVVKPAVKMTTQGAKEFVDNGTLWDAYTTFSGRFGNYGDNIFTKIYGTAARRFGLPDKARIPADAMRKIKGDIHIDNGVIDLTGNKPYLGNPHVNMTLDRGVVSHSKGQWDGADTYVVPTNNFIEQSSEALKSIEPSDMFSNGAKVTEIPKNVTLISGDIKALNKAKEAGIQTLSSPKLRRIYEDGMREYKVEKAMFDEQYANTTGLQRRLLKAPESPKYRRWWPEYAEEMQRLQTRRGTPTLADFKLLEQRTGLKSGVAPLLERDKAIKQLGAMRSAYVLDIMSGKVQPYVYPNGRIVDWDKAAEELELIQRAKYNNVFYDPASHVESEWQAANGVR